MGCEVRETQSSNGSRRPARSGRGHATTNHLERNRPLARHSGAAKGEKIEGAMSHSDARESFQLLIERLSQRHVPG